VDSRKPGRSLWEVGRKKTERSKELLGRKIPGSNKRSSPFPARQRMNTRRREAERHVVGGRIRVPRDIPEHTPKKTSALLRPATPEQKLGHVAKTNGRRENA